VDAETAYFLSKLESKVQYIFSKSKNQLITMLLLEVLDDLRAHIKTNLTNGESNVQA
jgi:hypothetical protein